MARTLLLGLDGMTFSVMDALVSEGRLPFLKRCMQEGVRADLLSTANPLTPPAWTTMLTGRGPGAHGIFDFVRAREREDGPFYRFINSHDVRCETIWSVSSRQGRRVISLYFPAMFPAKPIDGFIVPGYITARMLRTSIYPRDLYPRIKALPGFNPKDFAWNLDESRKGVEGMPPEEYEKWIQYVLAKDIQWFDILRLLMTEEPWDLAGILCSGPDALQHLCWRFLDPQTVDRLTEDWEWRVRDLCLRYFAQLDHRLEEIVTLAGPGARVFLASDHGAGGSTELFFANAWLASMGYLTWKGGEDLDPEKGINWLASKGFLAASDMKGFYAAIDWPRTKAYVRTPSSNAIYIREARPGWGGVSEDEYPAFRARLIDD
ncbi:MAG: alkaline phosphatase family protein, partial [Thermoplasmata archaeon]